MRPWDVVASVAAYAERHGVGAGGLRRAPLPARRLLPRRRGSERPHARRLGGRVSAAERAPASALLRPPLASREPPRSGTPLPPASGARAARTDRPGVDR